MWLRRSASNLYWNLCRIIFQIPAGVIYVPKLETFTYRRSFSRIHTHRNTFNFFFHVNILSAVFSLVDHTNLISVSFLCYRNRFSFWEQLNYIALKLFRSCSHKAMKNILLEDLCWLNYVSCSHLSSIQLLEFLCFFESALYENLWWIYRHWMSGRLETITQDVIEEIKSHQLECQPKADKVDTATIQDGLYKFIRYHYADT